MYLDRIYVNPEIHVTFCIRGPILLIVERKETPSHLICFLGVSVVFLIDSAMLKKLLSEVEQEIVCHLHFLNMHYT